MPRPVRRLAPLPPLPHSLRLVAGLSEKQFSLLNEEVEGKGAFSREHSRVQRFASALNITQSDILGLMASLEFLYERCHAWRTGDTAWRDTLREFLESTALWAHLGDDAERAFSRLADLLKPHPLVERERKRQWLRTGVLERGSSFASFVDIRPNFSDDRTGIEELLISVIFRIDLESESGSDKGFVFQLTERGLLQLRDAVNDAIKKLDLIRSDRVLSPRIAQISEDRDGV